MPLINGRSVAANNNNKEDPFKKKRGNKESPSVSFAGPIIDLKN
jgi:hypothetical protein